MGSTMYMARCAMDGCKHSVMRMKERGWTCEGCGAVIGNDFRVKEAGGHDWSPQDTSITEAVEPDPYAQYREGGCD